MRIKNCSICVSKEKNSHLNMSVNRFSYKKPEYVRQKTKPGLSY